MESHSLYLSHSAQQNLSGINESPLDKIDVDTLMVDDETALDSNDDQTHTIPINQLPPEILHEIFWYLFPGDLIRCMQVSKSWYVIAGRILYRDIRESKILRTRRDDEENGDSGLDNAHRKNYNSNLFGNIWRFFGHRGKGKLGLNDKYKILVDAVSGKFTLCYRHTNLYKKRHKDFGGCFGFCNAGEWVRYLDLSCFVGSLVNDNELDIWFNSCPNITTLNLSSADITDKSIQALSRSECSRRLKSLNLSHCYQITDESLVAIAKSCPNLQSINLKLVSQITDIGLVELANSCKNLKRLRIHGCKLITNFGISTASKHLEFLTWLDIGHCMKIGDEGLLEISRNCLALQWLDVSRISTKTNSSGLADVPDGSRQGNPAITDKSIMELAKNCSQLELLDLSYCSDLTDKSLCYIGVKGHNLKSLSLKGLHKITGESVFQLGELRRRYHKLIWLQIYNCRNITSNVIDEMIKKLSDGWRKGPYDTKVHREVMNGKSWDDVGDNL